ncbi:hypothetical protein DMUE_5529 [Dictyocoela muelleri]|nr:hypothetical protein DMUE_5529 [Dictyocoela muelleri]
MSIVDPFMRIIKRKKSEKLKIESKIKNISHKEMNKTRKGYNYKVGDLVYRKTHSPDKIDNKYVGPFEILKLDSKGNYVILNEIKKISRQNIKNITPAFELKEAGCRIQTL